MNKLLPLVLTFAGGAVTGALFMRGYILKKANEKAEVRINEEIAKYKEDFTNDFHEGLEELSEEDRNTVQNILGIASPSKDWLKAAQEVDSYSQTLTIEEVGKVESTLKSTIEELKEIIAENGYTHYADMFPKNKGKSNIEYIHPDEMDDDFVSYTMFSDGIVADERDRIIKNPEITLGSDFKAHLGDFEDDILYVYNKSLPLYIEVTIDQRTYADVVGETPEFA